MGMYNSTDCAQYKDDSVRCPKDCCNRTGYGYVDVNLPVDLNPDVSVGTITTECVGDAEVNCDCTDSDTGCKLILTQRFKITIPVCCKLDATAGDSFVTCPVGE